MQEIRLLSSHNQYWGDGGVCVCMKMYMQAPFVCSFIFSFFSMLGMKDKPSTDLRRRIFMAEVEVIKAVEGPILRKRDYPDGRYQSSFHGRSPCDHRCTQSSRCHGGQPLLRS